MVCTNSAIFPVLRNIFEKKELDLSRWGMTFKKVDRLVFEKKSFVIFDTGFDAILNVQGVPIENCQK